MFDRLVIPTPNAAEESTMFDRLVIPTPKAEESATPRSCGASEYLDHRSVGHAS